MAIPNDTIESGPYVGNGVTQNFDYDFQINNEDELVVLEMDTTGAISTLVLNTDYTVTDVGDVDGGQVQLAAVLTDDHQLLIRLRLDETQETDFTSQGGFFPQVHESALDKLTRLIQIISDRSSRALRYVGLGAEVYDAGDRRIANVADATKSKDAANRAFVESLVGLALTDGSFGGFRHWTYTGNGATAVYSIDGAHLSDERAYLVHLDGEYQTPGADYTIDIGGEELTFAANVGDNIEIDILQLGFGSTEAAITAAEEALASASDASDSADAAATSATNAAASETKAEKWADENQDVEVEPGKFSAKHWALEAQETATGTLTYRGDWDASTGSFPSSPMKGDTYRVNVPGTVDAVEYFWGDAIVHNGGDATKAEGWTLHRSKHSLRNPQTTWLQRRAGGVIFMFWYPAFSTDSSGNGTANVDEPTWQFRTFVEEIKRQSHVDWVVVVNPISGPGASVDGNWTQAIEWLKGAGATVIGYVSTDFGGPYDPDGLGGTSLSTEQEYLDILTTWVDLYPEIDGFWLDEIPFYTQDSQSPPNPTADEARAFYTRMTQHAKLNLGKLFVGANPGQEQADDIYFQENVFDLIMIYEKETEPTESDLKGNYGWRDNSVRVYPSRKAIMPHNLNAGVQLAADDIASRVKTNSQWVDYIFYWHDDEYGNVDAWDADNFQHHVRAVGEGWRRAYSVTGVEDLASVGEPNTFTKQQGFGIATLTDGANIGWNLENEQVAEVTLGGNRTLDNPTNLINGFSYLLYVRQDGVGGHTLSFDTNYDFGNEGGPTLSTGAGEGDLLGFVAVGGKMIFTGIKQGFSA